MIHDHSWQFMVIRVKKLAIRVLELDSQFNRQAVVGIVLVVPITRFHVLDFCRHGQEILK